ncbi:MAG: histidinol-phosphate aminotransferase [Candidatus Deianiraeaceae bacterium]|jgi:histidinol-phosphate aminotransferase
MYKVTQSEGFLNLSLNENYFSFCQNSTVSIPNLNIYPDINLYNKIEGEASKLYDVKTENVLLTNGSDDGIFLLQQAFAKKSIIITDPTFSMYEKYAKNLGLEVIKQPLNGNLTIDVSLLIDNIFKYKPCIVFIPNPNSPTGTMLAIEEIEGILKTGARIVIDEAYIEFSGNHSSSELLEKYHNLIILRTLSKFYGCAAVRIGFVICNNITEVKKYQAPFSVSTINAQVAYNTLLYVNQHGNQVKQFTRDFIYNREDFLQKLLQKNFGKIYKTEANFVLFEVLNIHKTLENFQAQKFLVKNFTNILPNTIRVSLASKEINEQILDCVV